MNLLIPRNIFTELIIFNLPELFHQKIFFESGSLICNNLMGGNADIGLIPSLDLLSHEKLYVLADYAVSFDGPLSNSYVYFKPEQFSVNNLLLQGDVTSNEIILSKILFRERFNLKIEITLDSSPLEMGKKNYLIAGNDNLIDNRFLSGMSFSDQIAELLDYPYVNYVFVSRDKSKLIEFGGLLDKIEKRAEDNLNAFLNRVKVAGETRKFISDNFDSIYFEMTKNEKEGLHELLRLPYYFGITEDISEIKFI